MAVVNQMRTVGLSLLLCFTAQEAAAGCQFQYTDRIRSEVVYPLIKKRFDQLSAYFDLDKVGITRKKDEVSLIFTANKTVNGRSIHYENAFVVVIDACTKKVIETYDGAW